MPRQVKAVDAAEYYKISISNLRKWAREGRINVIETPGGHYLYTIPDADDTIAGPDTSIWSPNIIYSRVPSNKNRNDLARQSMLLQHKYPTYTLIEDIGSGINYKRPGFRAILEQLFKGNVKTVVVAHPDRFARFGFEFFQWIFSQFGAVLDVVERPKSESKEELVEDIMEVFSKFSSRYYDLRKYKESDEKEDEAIPQKSIPEHITTVTSGLKTIHTTSSVPEGTSSA